jgi:2-methylcitrate dehydratase PrpD
LGCDVREAVRALGRFVAELPVPEPGSELGELLHRTLLDTLGVVVAGAQTSEMRALARTWAPASGPARVLGSGLTAAVEPAAYLNGVASVCLELDEGNKYARGHPATHVLPAALAVAQARRAAGPELAAAFLAGHEVACRFGRATRLHPEVHPHGNWGLAGGAAACARLMGLDVEQTAAAIDAASAMAIASPWPAATEGDLVRNAWMGSAAVSAIAAARLAAAGLARLTGLAATTLGSILGDFDAAELTSELGRRFDIGNAYFKRHASCSYTHPAADAVLEVRAVHPGLEAPNVRDVLVETYPIAATLNGARVETRLAGMFSIPYVVAAVVVAGHARPSVFDDQHRAHPEIRRLMGATRVVATDEFARRLPDERGARVILTLRDGSELVGEVPNPVGDTAYHPFGLPEVRAKLDGLLPPGWEAGRFEALVRLLVSAPDVNQILEQMP